MKPPRHFIANIASRYFTSVALNASQIPICRVVMAHWWLQFAHVIAQYTQMLFMQHLQIARVIADVFWRKAIIAIIAVMAIGKWQQSTVGVQFSRVRKATSAYIVEMQCVERTLPRRVPTALQTFGSVRKSVNDNYARRIRQVADL